VADTTITENSLNIFFFIIIVIYILGLELK
jgi:hypothetical protein